MNIIMKKEIKGKKLLILGGMKISCEIVKKAKEMGAYVVVTDYNEPEKSPAKLIADESFMVSTTDIDEVVKLIQREKIDGVLTGFVDLLLPYYAEICEKSGLPCYATKDQFITFIDKNKYKALLKEYDVPTPKDYIIENILQVEELNIEYPVIVKPSDSSGARGVQICYTQLQLEEAYHKAIKFSPSKSVMVEEFVQGEEATVFWIIQDGEPYFVALGNRHVEKNQGKDVIALPVGYTYPSKYTSKYMEDIAPNVKKMLKSANIKNGMLFMQCVISNGIPKVYDLGLRLTGSLEYYMLEKLCGFNPMEMLIQFALTGSMGDSIKDKVDPYLDRKYGWNISFLMKPGKIESTEGIDTVRSMTDVLAAVVAHDVGEEILETEKGLLKQICCRVLGASETIENMEETIKEAEKAYKVLDHEGKSLLLPVMDIERYLELIE